MSSSLRSQLLTEARSAAAFLASRYVSIGARVRVYDRGPGDRPVPAELLPRVYGGKFDTLLGAYVGPPDEDALVELSCSRGQVALLEAFHGIESRLLLLAAPGSGKTEGAILLAALSCLTYPSVRGGITAPVIDKVYVAEQKFISLVRSKGWLKDYRTKSRGRPAEIELINGAIAQLGAVKKASKGATSPIAGYDWHWAVEDEQSGFDDEACREVDARGRVNANFRVFSSATNENNHQFQRRVLEYTTSADKKVIRLDGFQNVFTPLAHWEGLRAKWSKQDFDRFVKCEAVIQDGRVYPEFSLVDSTQPIPVVGRDITADITFEKYRTPYQFVIGTDPGRQTTVSIIMKAFAGPSQTDRIWYVVDEITTIDKTMDWHGQELTNWFRRRGMNHADAIVIGDPHTEHGKEADRTDYLMLKQRHGFNVVKANAGAPIDRKHRFSMVNALLQGADGRRRLFLVPGPNGSPQANRLSESLGFLLYASSGEPEAHGKGPKDLTHWADALGYGLYPFEKLRGTTTTHTQPSSAAATTLGRMGRRNGT